MIYFVKLTFNQEIAKTVINLSVFFSIIVVSIYEEYSVSTEKITLKIYLNKLRYQNN